MSEVEWVTNLLQRDWTPSISNRTHDVPDHDSERIVWTRNKKESNARLKRRDVGYIVSGGDTNYTPQGFGHTHQRIDTVVAIEYRAAERSVPGSVYSDPHRRLVGSPTGSDGLQAPDRWDGIAGETTRVLLGQRKGLGQWDTVGSDALRVVDNIDTGGKNYYRVDVVVGLVNEASNIDTSV